MPIPNFRVEGFYQEDAPPPLEPEEELEMLLNLYGFGMAKNFTFLQPNQFERLIEAKKIFYSPSGKELVNPKIFKPENARRIVDAFMFALYNSWETTLIEHMHWCTREDWQRKTQQQKAAVMEAVFLIEFGIKTDEVPDRIFSVLTEDSN